MGEEGLYMQGVKGLYHPQRTPRVQTPAFYPGAIPGAPKTDPTVTDLKVLSVGVGGAEWEAVEEAWWSSWSDEADGTLRVWNRAGTKYRWQPYRIQKWPDDDMDTEPDEEWPWALPLVSYRPGWRGQTITSTWSGTGSGTLALVNPGDLPCWAQISLTNSGVEQWTVPDGIGGDTVQLEVFDASVGDLFVDTDQFELQLESDVESQIAASLLGLRFRQPIPPRTTVPVNVPISVTGRPGAAKAYMTPMWLRPW
ncbi:hypothetical protein ACFQNE_02085 [Gordonia phosphorivorans]|uniref:Phage tail protein n=1 Tax=Gordonia phosphorivorans TaxID=1056982 RepID=A0ABV6H6J5_9ACTN